MPMTNLRNGALGGLAGGVVFGVMMGMMGMLAMIGRMLGMPFAGAGFGIHMMISAIIGASFGLFTKERVLSKRSGALWGIAYGSAWWVLGPLTIMPLMSGMGLGASWNLGAAGHMLPSLMGHMIYGLILGLVYAHLKCRDGRRPGPAALRSAASVN